MSKVLHIADQRAEGALERLLESLDYDFEAMLRKNSAEGMLRSGNTIKQAMNLVSENSDSLKDLLIEQSSWVIKQSIYVPLSISEDLIDLCEKCFDIFIDETEEYIQKSTDISGQPKLFSRMYPEVEESIERSASEAKLEIEALVFESRSSGIKGIAKYMFSLISKLWGG